MFQTVLELGSGATGVGGIACGMAKARRVYMTDKDHEEVRRERGRGLGNQDNSDNNHSQKEYSIECYGRSVQNRGT